MCTLAQVSEKQEKSFSQKVETKTTRVGTKILNKKVKKIIENKKGGYELCRKNKETKKQTKGIFAKLSETVTANTGKANPTRVKNVFTLQKLIQTLKKQKHATTNFTPTNRL